MPPIARESPGSRGLYLARPSDDELLTVWLWDSEADWEAALARFGPLLQEYVVPNLAEPEQRITSSSGASRDGLLSDGSSALVHDRAPWTSYRRSRQA
jgi:hypothetical protein